MNSGLSSAGGIANAACRSAPRLIKRYVNRKLYDTVESRYVTLDEIAHMIKVGDEVQIVEERTDRDLTGATLVQIILEEEKRTARVSLRLLNDLIRNGLGNAEPSLETRSADLADRSEASRERCEQRLYSVLERGQQASDRAKEMVASSQQAVLQLQRKMNERVGSAFEVVAAVGKLKRELTYISGRIGDLEERLRGIRDDAAADLTALRRCPEVERALS